MTDVEYAVAWADEAAELEKRKLEFDKACEKYCMAGNAWKSEKNQTTQEEYKKAFSEWRNAFVLLDCAWINYIREKSNGLHKLALQQFAERRQRRSWAVKVAVWVCFISWAAWGAYDILVSM